MSAESELVVQHSFRRRLDDSIGLGLLLVATALSFTGLVDLSRFMHPVRFALLIITAICAYQVMTKTFARVVFTDASIEATTLLSKARSWKYQQLKEVRETTAASSLSLDRHKVLRFRFDDGSTLEIDSRMAKAATILTFLGQREHQFTITRP